MSPIRVFLLIYVVAIGFMYYFAGRAGIPPTIPGDILILKAGRKIYIPIASSLVITILLFILLRYWTKAF